MDYKKAYEEALERAKSIYNENPSSSTAKFVCGQIFPEIKESEDERIRKELWEYFHDIQLKCDNDFSPSFTIDDILAYLEKQKEQKPAEWSTEFLHLMGITISQDGNQMCVLLGENLAEGIAGFGDTLADAVEEFKKEWRQFDRFRKATWKPSEEQMKALGDVITMKRGNEYETTMLRTLYNDLKKLM